MVAVESPVKVVPCEGVVYSRSTAPVKVKVKPRSGLLSQVPSWVG